MMEPIDSQKGEEAANLGKRRDERVVARDEAEMPIEAKRRKLNENESDEAKKSTTEEEENADGDEGEKCADEEAMAAAIAEPRKSVVMSIWVWDAMLKSVTRMEMAERVSLVCHGLKKLCWPRLHGDMVAPHFVDELRFRKWIGENGQPRAVLRIERSRRELPWVYKEIPIATGAPPPDYIEGFKSIDIEYLNSEVLQFMRNIRPLLVDLSIIIFGDRTLPELRDFFATLNGSSINYLQLSSRSISFLEFRQHFPGRLEQIPAISLDVNRAEWHAWNELILAKHQSGKPFLFKIRGTFYDEIPSTLVNHIKEAFQSSTRAHSFRIAFYGVFGRFGLAWDEFRLENEGTGEVLILEGTRYRGYQLYRCPRGEIQNGRKWQTTMTMDGIPGANETDIFL